MLKILSITVKNFNTFSAESVIGPLDIFTMVTSKECENSNFIDAVRFVLGENESNFRVKGFEDLIHSHGDVTASVKMVCEMDDGDETTFTRCVAGYSAKVTYSIDTDSVTSNEYLRRLETMKLNVKTSFISQNTVECIETLMSQNISQDITKWFADISGSNEYKEEYLRLEQESLVAQDELSRARRELQYSSMMLAEVTSAREQIEQHEQMKDLVNGNMLEMQLFRLLHAERHIQSLEQLLQEKQDQVEECNTNNTNARKKLEEYMRRAETSSGELPSSIQKIKTLEATQGAKTQLASEAKEAIACRKKSVESARNRLDQENKEHSHHLKVLEALEFDVSVLEAQQVTARDELQAQGFQGQLSDAEEQQYCAWKEAAVVNKPDLEESANSRMEQYGDEDLRDEENYEKAFAKIQKDKSSELKKYLAQTMNTVANLNAALEENQVLRQELQERDVATRESIQELTTRKETIDRQIARAYEYRHKVEEKNEFDENLKRLYKAGVFGRLTSLCRPKDPKHRAALSSVIADYMDAIVVDTRHTADLCADYILTHCAHAERILVAADLESEKKSTKTLRTLRTQRNVQLLFNELEFEPPAVQGVALRLAGNIVIADDAVTDTDALKLSRDSSVDVVTLGGSIFRHEGAIKDYGKQDVVQAWDERVVAELAVERKRVGTELREMKQLDLEEKLNEIGDEIAELNIRLEVAEAQLTKTTEQISALGDLPDETQSSGSVVSDRQRDAGNRSSLLDMSRLGPLVFSKFADIGDVQDKGLADTVQQTDFADRAEHEKSKRRQQELQNKLRECDALLSVLRAERHRAMAAVQRASDSVQRCQLHVTTQDDTAQAAELALNDSQREFEVADQEMVALLNNRDKLRTLLEQSERTIVSARCEMNATDQELQTLSEEMATLQSQLQREQKKITTITKFCQRNGIAIPRLRVMEVSNASEQSLNDFDYSRLSDELTHIADRQEVDEKEQMMMRDLCEMVKDVNRQEPPNNTITRETVKMAELTDVEVRRKVAEAVREEHRISEQFRVAMVTRRDKFNSCFDHVAAHMDAIYKELTGKPTVRAMVQQQNVDEPYLGGTTCSFMTSDLGLQPMSALSAGEKALASLALLLAVHSFRPSPLLLLDHLDSALEDGDVDNVTQYLRQQRARCQIIAAASKPEFISRGDAHIAIVRQRRTPNFRSVIGVDLNNYTD